VILTISPTGQAHCLYTEAIPLDAIGRLAIRRASNVEPDANGLWYADMGPVGGGVLGPFDFRSEALAAEVDYLETNIL
jgi:hypothetical protein